MRRLLFFRQKSRQHGQPGAPCSFETAGGAFPLHRRRHHPEAPRGSIGCPEAPIRRILSRISSPFCLVAFLLFWGLFVFHSPGKKIIPAEYLGPSNSQVLRSPKHRSGCRFGGVGSSMESQEPLGEMNTLDCPVIVFKGITFGKRGRGVPKTNRP